MKKRNYLEMIGILSLSLMLTSTMAVSSTLPDMLNLFSGYSRSSVELLFSVPAFSMVVIIALTPLLTAKLSERALVVSGLLLYGIFGLVPFFSTSYPVILLSRLLMGAGNGMVNIKAVSLIGQRFSGDLQLRLQGIRCSMETLGQAGLTLVSGQLLYWGWNYAYLIYTAAFFILGIYLLFVPASEDVTEISEHSPKKTSLSPNDWMVIVKCSLLGCLFVSSSVSFALRLTNLITDLGVGSATDGATVLSIATLFGFLGGLVFGNLCKWFSKHILSFSMISAALGLVMIAFGNSLAAIAIGACIFNFFMTNCVSHVFGSLSENLPQHILDTANAALLVGCNLGSFVAPFLLQIIGYINPSLKTGFFAYGIIFIAIAFAIFLQTVKKPR